MKSASPATVLIVDDERDNVDVLEQELADAGYRTLSAPSGEAAIETARAAQPDLILLDVMMGGIDGYETCRRLKAGAASAVPVIFLTALSDSFQKVRGFGAGAVDYVTKPFDLEELLARIKTHIALRDEFAPSVKEDGSIIGDSPAIARVRQAIARVALTDSTVLIQGETGTGKELAANAITARAGDGSGRW